MFSNLKTATSNKGGAKSGALLADHDVLTSDPDLQTVIEHWSTLPAALKAGILAMVKAGN